MSYLESTKLVVKLDNKLNTSLEASLVYKEDGSIYLPLRQVAELYGYQTYNGEYYNKSEQTGKCYVDSEVQSVDFEANSNKIYRISHKATMTKHEYDYLQHPIEFIDNQLYINSEDLEKAIYVTFGYEKSTNTMSMVSLAYYVNIYNSKALEYGFTEFDLKYENTLSIFDGILIGKSNGKYGCVDLSTKQVILESKYDDITYLRSNGEFLVKSSNLYGIIDTDKNTKIQIEYDNIELMNNDSGLYLLKKSSKYGIANKAGEIRVYPEYTQIGADITKFTANEIDNKYFIGNDFIPVQIDGKWGFLNLDLDTVVEPQFTSLGYVANGTGDAVSLLEISEYGVIVAGLDGKYTLISPTGELLYTVVLDKVYMTQKEGENSYYISYKDEIYDAIEELENKGIEPI